LSSVNQRVLARLQYGCSTCGVVNWRVTDDPSGFARFEEGAHEPDRLIGATELVSPYGATRQDDGIVVVWGDLGESLLYREGFARVEVVVEGLGFAGLDADGFHIGASIFDGLLIPTGHPYLLDSPPETPAASAARIPALLGSTPGTRYG
jgi:hypothetical protein